MKILVLDVPGLHLGYLGCYGNDWVATPNIDRLASDGVVFDRHIFDVDQPKPIAWTGQCALPTSEAKTHPPGMTLGQALRARNVLHAVVEPGRQIDLAESAHHVISRTLELEAGGHAFIWTRFPPLAPPWHLPRELLDSYCEEEDEPWPDPPHGYLENTDDLPRLQNTYAAVVTYLDAQLGALLDQLSERNQFDDMLICLTAAHGLPLAEHGIIGYVRPWLHEEFVHLPLILRLPRAEQAGLRVDALTQPVDLFATFLEYLGIAAPPSDGHSLWPLIKGEVTGVRTQAVSGLRAGGGIEWALRTSEWAFLLPVVPCPGDSPHQARLYVKPEDRWEVNNVLQHHMELGEEIERTLRAVAVQ